MGVVILLAVVVIIGVDLAARQHDKRREADGRLLDAVAKARQARRRNVVMGDEMMPAPDLGNTAVPEPITETDLPNEPTPDPASPPPTPPPAREPRPAIAIQQGVWTLPVRETAGDTAVSVPFAERVRAELVPQRLLVSVVAGLVAGLMAVVLQLSFAALIFSGELAPFVARGMGLTLFSAMVISFLVMLMSSFAGVVATPQGGTSAILATIATAVVVQMPPEATPEAIYLTVVAAIAVTSVLTGLFFVLLGFFKLGNLVRFLPYPVVGGFLAGTGWLLVRGAIKVMSDVPVERVTLARLFEAQNLMLWLPGVLIAVALTAVVRWRSHFLIIPAAIVLVLTAFYAITLGLGYSVAELTAARWLFEPFPSGNLWQPITPNELALVDWRVLVSQVGSVGTVMIISVVALLLRASGIELTTQSNIDFNRELVASGVANIVASFGGGLVGYPSLSLSVLGHKFGANSRIIGGITAVMCAFLLFIGAPVLAYFPKLLLGGLLVYLGFGFLIKWLYEARTELGWRDYIIVWLILIVINAVGVLEGIGLGVLVTVVLFAIDYSRISVVKHELSGKNYNSRVDRSRLERQLLKHYGDDIYILELQGYIFFGTANALQEQLNERFEASHLPTPRCVLLDFRQVIGIDASAVLSFTKLQRITHQQGIHLVFTAMSEKVRCCIEKCTPDEDETWHIFTSLDYGAEWCEEQILASLHQQLGKELFEAQTSIFEQMDSSLTRIGQANKKKATRIGRSAALKLTRLMPYLELREVPADSYLIRQGDPPSGIYFVGSGQVTALREMGEGETAVRLRTMGTGTIVGEVGYFLGSTAVASIVTDIPSTIYFLSAENLAKMAVDSPQTAVAFNAFIAQLLAERLSDTVQTMEALQR